MEQGWNQRNLIRNNFIAYFTCQSSFFLSNRPELKILLENDVLVSIANKYNKSSAQICLRWGIQRGLVMLPKS